MQVPEGKTLAGARSAIRNASVRQRLEPDAIDASGMVHQKPGRRATGQPLPTAPGRRSSETRYLYYPTTAATLNLAAVAAQAARVWKTIDPAFSAKLPGRRSSRAFAAARAQSGHLRLRPVHRQRRLWRQQAEDEFYWAAAELYATTGEVGLREADLRASPLFLGERAASRRDIGWASVKALGTITLALAPNSLKPAEIAQARANLVASADR
jgi:endoglucanase